MALSSSDVAAIYNLLENALSQDQALRKPAEAALASCENRPGFCSLLLEIMASKDLNVQSSARWLATVFLKNTITRHWRLRRESAALSDAEKSHVRSKLLELIREENSQIAGQLTVIISKVARFDYPREWPDLFVILIQKLQTEDVLLTQRVYMVYNQVLKELSTKRLVADQKNLMEVTAQLFDYTWHHFHEDTEKLLKDFNSLASSTDSAMLTFETRQILELRCQRWLLCLKALRRMLKFGFPSDAKTVQEVAAVKQVCPPLIEQIKYFLGYGTALPEGHPLRSFFEKSTLKLLKTLIDVQTVHPFTFSDSTILPPLLELCYCIITEPKNFGDSFEPVLIQSMLLIQTVVMCKEYIGSGTGRVIGQTNASVQETKETLAQKAEGLLKSLLDNQRILLLCDTLVRRYFTLTATDLEEWGSNAETFYHEQDMVQWKDRLRPCSESLYLILFEKHREIMAPLVVQILKQSSEDCPPAPPGVEIEITPKLLLKEAAYNAAGIANYDLHDTIDFDSWYNSTLSQELCNKHPNGRILRRRVAWLLGQWVSKIAGSIRQTVYTALIDLLGDGDLAVQLAACRSLHHLIDDVHFYENDFVAFVPTCLERLLQFMTNAQEFDSKLQVFNLISLIIDRLGENIVPCSKSLITFLPQVWEDSECESLLRIQVIVALQRLISALGPQSPVCYEFLLPILDYCVNINQPDELNMLEDGLQLWHTTLKHAPVMTPQLLSLFSHLVAVMERNLDHFEIAMKIIESYVLLGGVGFLQLHSTSVVHILNTIVGNVNEKGMLATLSVVEMLIQCFPGDAPALLEGILQKLLKIVIAGKDEADTVRAIAGAILGRVLVQNTAFFAQWISQPSLMLILGPVNPENNQNILFSFFDAWLDKVDSLTTFTRKKVCALALCVLLTIKEPQVLERLEQILSVCTSIIHQTDEDQDSSALGYDYFQTNASQEENASGISTESEERRKRQILASDPINNLSVVPLLKEKLQACSTLYGEGTFNTALSRLHPSLLNQLQQLLGT